LEGVGELLGGDAPGDPFPGVLEAVLVQAEASQLLLHFSEEEEVRRSQTWRIGGMLQQLDGSARAQSTFNKHS